MWDREITWTVVKGRKVQHASWDDSHIGCSHTVVEIERRQATPWPSDLYRVCRRHYCRRMHEAHYARVPDELAVRRNLHQEIERASDEES